MTTIDPAGYSEAGAHLFTWLADKVLGGAKKAFGWGWERVEWAKAQDRYDARIIQDYGQIRIFGQTTPKSLKDIFTDVYVLDTPTAYRRFDPAALAEHLWNEDRGLSFRHKERRPGEQLLSEGSKFYILGKPGAGKTTFLKHLAVREAQRGRWGACLGKIPIFVSLKQFGETSQSLFDFIVDEFAVCGFPDAAPFVETLLKEGKALVLFDGLDEVSKTEERDRRGEVTQMLAQFARQYGECHIVVTCRIAAVDYTFEPAFAYLEMADFAPDQVEAFVRAWFWDESDTDASIASADRMLTEWVKLEHAGIRDLGRNPLLLTLLCLNYAETCRFPIHRAEIYGEALDALLKKWDTSRQIQRGGLYKALSLGRKRQMFARIAFDAMARNEIVFAQDDLERWLVEYLVTVPELPEAIDIDGDAVLHEIVAQHGIFAEQAHGLFSFTHLTFQEYYAAGHIADISGSGALDTLLSHIDDDKWREVFLLTATLAPDASTFLTAFEAKLIGLAVSRPKLAAWLSAIGTRAIGSRTAYKMSAIRVYFVFSRAREDELYMYLDSRVSRAFDIKIDHAIDDALSRNPTLDPNRFGYLVKEQSRGNREILLENDRMMRESVWRSRRMDHSYREIQKSFHPFDLEGAVSLERAKERASNYETNRDLALATALNRALALARDLDGDLDRDIILDRDRACVHDFARNFLRRREPASESDLTTIALISMRRISSNEFDVPSTQASLFDFFQQQGHTDPGTMIAALSTPDHGAPDEVWDSRATELQQLIEVVSGFLNRYRRLETEADELRQEQDEVWLLDSGDVDALVAYVNANRLFYDCLQLAYTPDRRAFEDRIFWLPPDLNQQ